MTPASTVDIANPLLTPRLIHAPGGAGQPRIDLDGVSRYSPCVQSEPPGVERDQRERERRRLERVLPELIKRLLDAGYDKISEGPENVRHFVSEMKLPKEVLNLLLAQMDETKNGLYRVVAAELRDFLEHSNLSDEVAKVLTTLTLEIKTEVRFVPSDASAGPEVRNAVRIKRDEPADPPDEAAETGHPTGTE